MKFLRFDYSLRLASIAAITQIILIVFLWFRLIISPNDYFFAGGGDGIKNYYTPMYYLQYDKGTHFSGMHYPFGDNVVFSDNQPLICWLLKPIVSIGLFNPDYSIGLLNLLMLLSVVVCAWYLSRILSRYKVSGLSNILFAVSIATLSPQVLRFIGHYALAYCCFIPMLWYYLLEHLDSKRISNRFTIALVLVTLSFSFIHLYYALMAAAFIFLTSIIHPILSKTFHLKRTLFNTGLSSLPIIALTLYQFFTESKPDRLAEPFGITSYIAKPETILLPLEYNVFNVSQLFNVNLHYNYEGLAYIGLTGTLFLLVFITINIPGIKNRLTNPDHAFKHQPTLITSLLASSCILIFAFGIPIIWNPDLFLSLTPTLRQFRSLGRFAWIFYYVFNVYAAITIYHLFIEQIKPQSAFARIALILIVSLGWMVDGIQHHIFMRNIAVQNNFTHDFFGKRDVHKKLSEAKLTVQGFQAALVLPYFHIGSEKFYIENNNLYPAFKLSYGTGLPLMNASQSRSSVSETSLLVNIVGDSLLPKSILTNLTDKRPILVMAAKTGLSPNEQFLVNRSQYLFNDGEYNYLALYPDAFANEHQAESYLQSHWNTITAKKPTDNLQTCGDGFYSIRYPCRYDEFAWTNLTSTDPGNAITLADTIIDFKDSTQIELSLWLNIDPIKPAFPYLTITLVNQTNNEVFTDEIHPKQMASTFMNRLRVSYNRKLGHGTYQLKLLVHADKVLLGNVLIREADVHIKQILKENEYIDNYPIREQ